MAKLLDINFEGNDLSEFDSTVVTGGSSMAASGAAAMGGTNYGLAVTAAPGAGNTFAYGRKAITWITEILLYEFWFDPNSITMGVGELWHPMFFVKTAVGNVCHTGITWNGSVYSVTARIWNDAGSPQGVFPVIADQPQLITTLVTRATGESANDGSIEVFIDGVSVASKNDIDVFTRFRADEVFLGGYILRNGMSGTAYMDQFKVFDSVGVAGPLLKTNNLGKVLLT